MLCYTPSMAKKYFSVLRAPRYLDDNRMLVSGQLLSLVWPRMWKDVNHYSMYEVSKLNDGTWWIHPQGAWLGGWTKMPTTVGERIEKTWKYAESL